jgi:hypothetical protein
MYILSNWTILLHTKPDGEVSVRLRGEVFGNPRYQAGDQVTISVLRSCKQEGETVSVVTRSGSEYVLGKPSASEPEAVARVLRLVKARSTDNIPRAQIDLADPK